MDLTYDEQKQALRLRLNAMEAQPIHWQDPCSTKQAQAIVYLFNQGLFDSRREIRLAVLKEIADIPVQSTKDLLKWEATCIIDFLKSEEEQDDWSLSEYGRKFITEAERQVTVGPKAAASPATTYQLLLC
jgi:hypothetical protein